MADHEPGDNEIIVRTARLVLDFIYDLSPVSTDEVTREKMMEIFIQCINGGDLPTREEVLPHLNITVSEQKAKLFKILK